ncbi:PREDICTED: craniofacial development protein 2-like, partial [Papilio xuthus]|uniref:Craniofacial development protein 2-like n=1 Tax=Papilio xuthus TaxID=66420 RepID=A0AAJ6ZWY6_PAPXU
MYIATLNTLSLRTEENLKELILALKDIKWDIIGLSEVRRLGDKIEEYENFILYHKGETPGKYGVGFLINKNIKKYIDEITGINERIAVLTLTFNNQSWSIIQVYSPTEQATKKEIDLFYEQLNNTIRESTHKNIIIMGDFNAQIGERRPGENLVLGPYCYGKRTRNGNKLLELAYEYNLKILNTLYKNRIHNRWTWISPGGNYKNEIDYILTNQ